MRYNKQVFISTEGHQHYQIVDENGFIIAVVSGFDKETNKKHAELLEKAPQMQDALEFIKLNIDAIKNSCDEYGELPTTILHDIEFYIDGIHKKINNILGK